MFACFRSLWLVLVVLVKQSSKIDKWQKIHLSDSLQFAAIHSDSRRSTACYGNMLRSETPKSCAMSRSPLPLVTPTLRRRVFKTRYGLSNRLSTAPPQWLNIYAVSPLYGGVMWGPVSSFLFQAFCIVHCTNESQAFLFRFSGLFLRYIWSNSLNITQLWINTERGKIDSPDVS